MAGVNTTFSRFMQILAAQGKDPHEQLREIRATMQRDPGLSEAWAVAFQATADYGALDNDEKEVIFRNMLDAYVMYKMGHDDDYWNALDKQL
jgi:hypothetical protein